MYVNAKEATVQYKICQVRWRTRVTIKLTLTLLPSYSVPPSQDVSLFCFDF